MSRQFLAGMFAAAFLMVAGNVLAAEPEPMVSNENGVEITATPQPMASGAKTLDFAVSLQTHVHPLSEDLQQVSVLMAGGKAYRPLGWEGSPPGGHHRRGILRFQAITPSPAALELQIQLTGESAPRSFKWQLK